MTELVRTRAELARRAGRGGRLGRAGADHGRAARRPRRADPDAGTLGRRGRGRRLFVNPLQFGPAEDLDRYPRTLERGPGAAATGAGVDLVFAPGATEMYPDGRPAVTVDPGPLGGVLEGASRPGHFAGVLTVVTKLLGLVRPDVAVFGEKDYQQLALIRRMVADLDLGVEIVGVPTVREPGRARAVQPQPLPRPRAAAAGAGAVPGAAGRRRRPAPSGAGRRARGGHRELRGVDVDYLALRGARPRPGAGAGPARLLSPPGSAPPG